MKQISHKEILELQAAGTPILCIDVREGYRQIAFDAGALKIPHNDITKNEARLRPFKETLTVVCCLSDRVSVRTTRAAAALQKMGFTDVRQLEKGMMAGWVMKVKPGTRLPVPAAAKSK